MAPTGLTMASNYSYEASRVIWKYPLVITDQQWLMMPRIRQMLTVQLQGGIPTIWALVNRATDNERVCIWCYGTGEERGREGPTPEMQYIGTVQTNGVWHFFEKRRQ